MSSIKQDLKVNQGKDRIYLAVKGTSGIQRLYVWMGSEYLPPQGKSYLARRRELNNSGVKQRVTRYFETLKQARDWQSQITSPASSGELGDDVVAAGRPAVKGHQTLKQTVTLTDVVTRWRVRHLSRLQDSTVEGYEKILRLHFGMLLPLEVRAISSDDIDEWLDNMIAGKDDFKKGVRISFEKELGLLNSLLGFYAESYRDFTFRSPLLRSHRKRAKLKEATTKSRLLELTESEFARFCKELIEEPLIGQILVIMATVQFYQALRVQEVAALDWKSAVFVGAEGVDSKLWVFQSVAYLRRKTGKGPHIKQGLKRGAEKYLQMLKETYDALQRHCHPGATGLIFTDPRTGTFFAYHTVKNAYDRAFKRAGLEQRGTHILRHGGAQMVYNDTASDIEVTKQALGNTSLAATLVYAKRDQRAHSDYAKARWSANR